MTLNPGEFIRRFLIHVLPNGFHRIRHCGLLASGTKAETIARARELIDAVRPAQKAQKQQAPDSATANDQTTHLCPCCGGRMNIIETLQPRFDTSIQTVSAANRDQDRYSTTTWPTTD